MNKLLVCILTLMSCTLHAQQLVSFTASVRYNTMGLKDNIEVVYYCEGDDVANFDRPYFTNFEIIDGPRTSQTSRRTIADGKETEKKTFAIYYMLRPTDTGDLVIEPTSVSLNNGTKLYCNKLTIKVKPGTIANTLNGGNYRSLIDDKYRLNMDVLSSSLPFVVCAGPTYVYDTSAISQLLSLINNEVRPLLRKDPLNKEQGIYWDHGLPRVHVSVKDTAGLRVAIAALYPKDDRAVFLTTINSPVEMMLTTEAEFNNKFTYYQCFDKLKRLLAEKGADTLKDRRIFTVWSFNNRRDRAQFKKMMKKTYTVENENDFTPKGPYSVVFSSITISGKIKMDDTSLRNMANTLMNYSDACHGSFMGLNVAK